MSSGRYTTLPPAFCTYTGAIISASPNCIIEPIANRLGVRFMATDFDREYGVFLNKMKYGKEKARYIIDQGFPVIENFWVGFVVMIAGLVVLDISEAIYMKAGLGCGPRDALMVGVGKRLRKLPIGAVSVLISLVVLTIGWILGGSVGLGTLIFMFCGGIVMQIVFKIIRFEPRDITHVGLHQMLKFEKK